MAYLITFPLSIDVDCLSFSRLNVLQQKTESRNAEIEKEIISGHSHKCKLLETQWSLLEEGKDIVNTRNTL